MFHSGHSCSNDVSVIEDLYLELLQARRMEEARWGWIPFAAFVTLLFLFWLLGYCISEDEPAEVEYWVSVVVLIGWGILSLIHMIVLPIWMLIASLRYWEIRRRAVAVAGLLFSVLAPAAMIMMLSSCSAA